MAQNFLRVIEARVSALFESAINKFFEELHQGGLKVANTRYNMKDDNYLAFITYYNPNVS